MILLFNIEKRGNPLSYKYTENALSGTVQAIYSMTSWAGRRLMPITGVTGTFGRKIYQKIVPWHYFRQAVMKLNPWLTEAQNRLLP